MIPDAELSPISVAWFRERKIGSATSTRRRPWLILAGLIAVGWLISFLPPALGWGMWGAGLVILVVYLRHREIKVFGPVCHADLLRTGRQGRYIAVRSMYAGLLLLVLAWVYKNWARVLRPGAGMDALFEPVPVPPHSLALFADSMFAGFVQAQAAAVLLLTPAYVASAITEEKEWGTLDQLLSTELEDQEIVLGKLASRLANLLLVLLAGLPILSLLPLLGGVDPALVLVSFTMTALTMLGLGSLSMVRSISARRVPDAVALWIANRRYLLQLTEVRRSRIVVPSVSDKPEPATV